MYISVLSIKICMKYFHNFFYKVSCYSSLVILKLFFSKSTSTESVDTKQPKSATTEYNAGNGVFFKLEIC